MAYEAADFKQALRLLSRCLELAQELPEKSFAIPACEIGLAAVMLAEGKANDAETRLSRCIAQQEGASTFAERELLGVALRFHAQSLIDKGDVREAEKVLLRSISTFEQLGSDCAAQLAYSLCDLSGLYLAQARIPEAEKHITRAMAIFSKDFSTNNPEYVRADMIYNVVRPMDDASRIDSASDAIQRMQYSYGRKHPHVVRAVKRYLHVLEQRGDKHRLEETQKRFASVFQ
jgi:tetratricopeptide (TPR) repeat protein